jgi:hypothetical protein
MMLPPPLIPPMQKTVDEIYAELTKRENR